MTAERDDELIARYNLGLFSEWAGDITYALAALSDIASKRARNILLDPRDAIRLAAETRYRRLRRHEERLLEFGVSDSELIVLETEHLRGVIRRVGPWEFGW